MSAFALGVLAADGLPPAPIQSLILVAPVTTLGPMRVWLLWAAIINLALIPRPAASGHLIYLASALRLANFLEAPVTVSKYVKSGALEGNFEEAVDERITVKPQPKAA